MPYQPSQWRASGHPSGTHFVAAVPMVALLVVAAGDRLARGDAM